MRFFVKVSGEAFRYPDAEAAKGPIRPSVLLDIAEQTARARQELDDLQIAFMPGGGNIYRGKQAEELGLATDRAHQAGMAATIVNSVLLEGALEARGLRTRLHSSVKMEEFAEPYIRQRVIHQMKKGYVIVIAGGMGITRFTTDSAAIQRASELDADLILKGTHTVDGLYDDDPLTNPGAKKFQEITFTEVVERGLKAMDITANTHNLDNNKIPIRLFNVLEPDNLYRTLIGEPIGTLIHA